ncbi:MAG: ribokinase [Rhodoglobus sp.]
MHGVIVVGSANVDQVFSVERIPQPGETVMSTGLAIVRGGKGQNQAVAAARAGAATTFIAARGTDSFGDLTETGLREDGIDVTHLRTVDAPTGTALIAVDRGGENSIIVEGGANAHLVTLTEDEKVAIADASVLLLQLEVPLETVVAAARAAASTSTIAVLNAAPIRDLPDELLSYLDILVVNEHEAAHLLAARPGTITDLVPTVVQTLGAAGAVLYRRGEPDVSVPAPVVTAVDATGAGDTFCGAFAAALAEGQDAVSALRFAVTAGSLSVQAHGAVPSIPLRAAIDAVNQISTS